METAIYRRSLNGERASEWPNEGWRVKRVGGDRSPSTPNGMGTGLLSRPELVRAQPTARNERGQKL
jgi:hypothetical protein